MGFWGIEMKREYVRIKDAQDSRDHVHKVHASAEVPQHFDLSPKCSAIEDQTTLGACTGHAIAGALEYLEYGAHQKPVRLSRLFIYYNERMLENTILSDAGANIRDGIKAIATWGVCSEEVWPYNIHHFKKKPSADAYIDAATRRAIAYASVPQTEHALTSCLASGTPIIFGISVFESFESEEVARTGIVPLPQPHEKNLGGHAVLIVGYDKRDRTFLVRNSWGVAWGLKGYFKLPFDFVLSPHLADSFWVVTRKL